MMDSVTERDKYRKLMHQALKESRERGIAADVATKEYRIAKAEKTLLLKAEGTPATLIDTLVKGDPVVAEAELNMNDAIVVYKSAVEAVNVYKIEVKIAEEDINREWHSQ